MYEGDNKCVLPHSYPMATFKLAKLSRIRACMVINYIKCWTRRNIELWTLEACTNYGFVNVKGETWQIFKFVLSVLRGNKCLGTNSYWYWWSIPYSFLEQSTIFYYVHRRLFETWVPILIHEKSKALNVDFQSRN